MSRPFPPKLLFIFVLSVIGLPVGLATGAVTSSDARESNAALEEIVVTAQKRAERLQDVPISMSVLPGSVLDKSSLESVTDALGLVPGVSTLFSNQGGGTQLTIRGVTAPQALFAGSSPIAYYLDSAPFGLVRSAIEPDQNAFDLNRIEVLRGPQGTLYGASALNGVVRVFTNDADLNDFDFKARTSISTTDGGGENYRGDMAVNLPIIDGKLAARVVAGEENLSGWVNSPIANNVNDAELRNLRVKVNALPLDNLSIAASVSHQELDYSAPNQAADNGRILSLLAQPISTHYNTYGLKIDYQLPTFSFSSSSGYLTYDNTGYLDTNPGVVEGNPPLYTDLRSRVFSEEINLLSKLDGPWRWTAGGFYRDAKDSDYQTLGDLLPAPVSFADTSKSEALFGDFGRRFYDNKLEWSLGLRYFHDVAGTQQLILFAEPPGTPLLSGTGTFNSTTPRAVLTWYPSTELTVYGSYSQGFRSGFPQDFLTTLTAPDFPPVKPDKLSNYEIGVKGTLFDQRVSFDASLYYMDWKDIQEAVGVPLAGAGNNTVPAEINGASASGLGIDLAASARPVEGVELGVNFSWNNLENDRAIYSFSEVLFTKGSRIDYSPEYTAGAFARYGFPMGEAFKGQLEVSARYTSQQTQHFLIPPEPAYFVIGNSMVIGRTSVRILSQTHWTTTLYADNFTNDRGTPSRSNIPDYDVRIRPRTVGAEIDYRYK